MLNRSNQTISCPYSSKIVWISKESETVLYLNRSSVSVVVGALRCRSYGLNCKKHNSPAVMLAMKLQRVSALLVGGSVVIPLTWRPGRGRTDWHHIWGSVSRLKAGKARALPDWVDYQEKPESDWGNRWANTKQIVITVAANTCWCFECQMTVLCVCV